jgi:hypothetical protein
MSTGKLSRDELRVLMDRVTNELDDWFVRQEEGSRTNGGSRS